MGLLQGGVGRFCHAGLVPGIHVLAKIKEDVDGRDFRGKDALRALARP
jgi:hypothetical protein